MWVELVAEQRGGEEREELAFFVGSGELTLGRDKMEKEGDQIELIKGFCFMNASGSCFKTPCYALIQLIGNVIIFFFIIS